MTAFFVAGIEGSGKHAEAAYSRAARAFASGRRFSGKIAQDL